MKGLLSRISLFGVVVLIQACSPALSTLPSYDITRLEAEILAFEEFDKTARYRPDAVLFTGSSSIRFWPDLGTDMAPVPSLNRGFGGSTIPEVNYFYDRIITKFRPSIIVLYCGENDLWMGRSVDDVVKDYKAFISKTKTALPETKVIFLSMKPSPARWEIWDKYVKGNLKIKRIIDKDPSQYYIDISKYMLGVDGQPMESIFIQDMLHMNEKGYEGWQKLVSPVIQQLYSE